MGCLFLHRTSKLCENYLLYACTGVKVDLNGIVHVNINNFMFMETPQTKQMFMETQQTKQMFMKHNKQNECS